MLKPFSLQELRARCRALLRRRREVKLNLRCGSLELNRMERIASTNNETIPLTNKEFALLEYLLLRRGHVVTRATLLEEVWKSDADTGNQRGGHLHQLSPQEAWRPSTRLVDSNRSRAGLSHSGRAGTRPHARGDGRSLDSAERLRRRPSSHLAGRAPAALSSSRFIDFDLH